MFSNFTKCWVLYAKIDDYVHVYYAMEVYLDSKMRVFVCVCTHARAHKLCMNTNVHLIPTC
jgi:hypothetical protein